MPAAIGSSAITGERVCTVQRDAGEQESDVLTTDHCAMLYAVANYFHERRRGLKRAAGYIGGAYVLGRYVLERLEDARIKVMQDRMAEDK